MGERVWRSSLATAWHGTISVDGPRHGSACVKQVVKTTINPLYDNWDGTNADSDIAIHQLASASMKQPATINTSERVTRTARHDIGTSVRPRTLHPEPALLK